MFSVCSLARVAVNVIFKSMLGGENADDKSYDFCAFFSMHKHPSIVLFNRFYEKSDKECLKKLDMEG